MAFTERTEPVPAQLRTEELLLRPITVEDTERDHAAVMDAREDLRLWRQSAWPEDDFTVEDNRVDVLDMQERHTAHRAFSYTVLDPDGTTCVGCVYVFAPDATFLARARVRPLGDERWEDVDAVVFFWVRRSCLAPGADGRLLAALRGWFADEWGLERTVFTTSETFTQQVELLDGTDLRRQFELDEPDTPRPRLVYG